MQENVGNRMHIIEDSLNHLVKYIEKNGWSGYDPFDILGHPFFLYVMAQRMKRPYLDPLLKPLILIPYVFPRNIRKFFRIEKTYNPKAAALLARGYLSLYKKYREPEYLQVALKYLDWLRRNSSKGYSGYAWGYPFDWQSLILIPKGTPSGVVTSIAVFSFVEAYEITGDPSLLDVAISSCDFFLNDLRITRKAENKICFSYTPIDDFRVHNANLWVASALSRVMVASGKSNFQKYIKGAVKCTLDDQRPDGGFYYWETSYAKYRGIKNSIDNFHTGYVLESLLEISNNLNLWDYIISSLLKGIQFYKDNFIENYIPFSEPKFRRGIILVDIHDCAQSIILFTKLYSFFGDQAMRDLAIKIALWTINNMQDKTEGYFYYRLYRWGLDKTAYIRWGQAWMFKALTDILLNLFPVK